MNDLLRLIQARKDRTDSDLFALKCAIGLMGVGAVLGWIVMKIIEIIN